jgi:hypothetical protein
MDPVRYLALVSVGRACAFAGLGIMTFMVGLSYDPLLCARSGAILVSILFVVLRYRAMRADRINHRRCEVWVMLQPSEKPPQDHAARLIRNAYRHALLRFADYALVFAGILWAVALALWLQA